MSVYQESGLSVNLTGLVHHRFEALVAYKKLSGQHLKEMDFFWLQPIDADFAKADTLVGLELKSYDQAVFDVNSLLANLLQKAKDSLAMLHAAWLDVGTGADLKIQLPAQYNSYSAQRKIKLIMLINVNSDQSSQLSALRTLFKTKIKGIENLYGVQTSLINLNTAQVMGLPVT